ncbi:hypothetical protein DYBT9275_04552 [Dyadobacter sp. CECT 9275]|uniref:Outer membrane protein beta-barrel domain-containing protein n=1 Tax=Dyadobacter helix TaxID=2822344 RepID=A0A916NDR1_9BACT|nr:porin family protein [Dyadobacter sp. CECT 9275]CAG5009698.1 hypothetical protein DYBT9275_04552 [Dyadobacter sp. CECT 9275]
MKKSILLTGLLIVTLCTILRAQTNKKPAVKSSTQKPAVKTSSASRQEAINKAREDSILAVYALAKQLAQQMVREDSIKKAKEAAVLLQQKEMDKKAAKIPEKSRTAPRAATTNQKKTANARATGGFWIGAKGGVNFSKWTRETDYDSEESLTALTGPSAGFVVKIPFNNFLGLEVEPGFSQRGVVNTSVLYSDLSDWERNELKLICNYLEMPVLLQFTPRLGPLEGILALGPELRYQIGSLKTKYTTKYYSDYELEFEESGETDLPTEGYIKKFDYGAVGVAGIAFPFSKLKIFVDGRYHYGLGNLDSGVGYSDHKVNNRGISFNAGILYRIGN